jgi:hypothetical protein
MRTPFPQSPAACPAPQSSAPCAGGRTHIANEIFRSRPDKLHGPPGMFGKYRRLPGDAANPGCGRKLPPASIGSASTSSGSIYRSLRRRCPGRLWCLRRQPQRQAPVLEVCRCAARFNRCMNGRLDRILAAIDAGTRRLVERGIDRTGIDKSRSRALVQRPLHRLVHRCAVWHPALGGERPATSHRAPCSPPTNWWQAPPPNCQCEQYRQGP